MAYDRDGTIGLWWRSDFSGGPTQFSVAQMQALIDETASGTNQGVVIPNATNWSSYWIMFLFPQARNLAGYFARMSTTAPDEDTNFVMGNLETSVNTTNGLDGTWVSHGAWTRTRKSTAVVPAHRSGITSKAANGIVAVRFRWSQTDWFYPFDWDNIHLYGTTPQANTPNALRLWHPTLDQEVDGAFFDWGDVQRNTLVSRDFRVKNLSPTLTATSVGITMEARTDTTPSNVSQHEFSLDGVNFLSSVNVGDLAPGAISTTVRMRRTTPGSAIVGLWNTRIVASAAAHV